MDMTHRCNKCGAQYESGGFYGGHDYCNTCYLMVKAKDERRIREEEEARQKKIDDRRKLVRDALIKEAAQKRHDELVELGKRRAAEEQRRREILAAGRQAVEQRIRKRRELSHAHSLGRGGQAGAAYPTFSAGQTAYDDPGVLPLDQQRGRRLVRVSKQKGREEREEEKWGAGFSVPEAAKSQLSLALEGDAPKLSAGKAAALSFLGRNSSSKRIEAELFVSAADSSGKKFPVKIEPKKQFIEAGGEAKYAVSFSAPAKGEVKLEAYLRENAFFIDESEGKSNLVELKLQAK
jgi:predicted  nucleic acid-binding Zn-ribbon protein